MKTPAVYMLASGRHGTLYAGVTSDLLRRVHQHRTGAMDGFAARYDVTLLVWYEVHESMESAIIREKQIKKWRRAWKIRRIEEMNPDWRDLYPDLS